MVPYSGLLSRIGEKYDVCREYFCELLAFAAPMDAMPPNFAEKTFVNSHKTAKLMKVFSLESCPLYGICLITKPYVGSFDGFQVYSSGIPLQNIKYCCVIELASFPGPRPASCHLQYGFAGRGPSTFSHVSDVTNRANYVNVGIM